MSRVFEATGGFALSPYDNDFDSVSMRSSTVVDSDYAADQVRRYDRSHQFRVPIGQSAPSNAINVQIHVLNNGTSATGEVKSAGKVISRNSEEKFSCVSRSRQQKLQIICLLIISLIIVVLVVTSVYGFFEKTRVNNKNFERTSGLPETTHPTTVFSEPSTSTEGPITYFSRSGWGANILMKGTKRLGATVKRIIIMDTQTEPCCNVSDCISFLRKRQKAVREEFFRGSQIKDIRENFLIDTEGTLYEGRGFLYEGQHTFDMQLTDYNSNAIGISFIGNYSSAAMTPSQKTAIHMFIQTYIDIGHISDKYLLYHRAQLSLNEDTTENNLYKTVQTWDHWTASPTIISKEEWGGLTKKDSFGYFSTIIYKSVAVGHSNTSSCTNLSSCSEIMRDLQLKDRDKYGEIRYNFVLGGEDLVFQGKSFDWNGAATSFALDVLFIGDYMAESPPQSLMRALEDFLKFAVNIGKLSEDYKLYGQRQLIEHTESPGDKLYEVLQNPPFDTHFDFNVTTPKPCVIGCNMKN